jgi:hypothetical protein
VPACGHAYLWILGCAIFDLRLKNRGCSVTQKRFADVIEMGGTAQENLPHQ